MDESEEENPFEIIDYKSKERKDEDVMNISEIVDTSIKSGFRDGKGEKMRRTRFGRNNKEGKIWPEIQAKNIWYYDKSSNFLYI